MATAAKTHAPGSSPLGAEVRTEPYGPGRGLPLFIHAEDRALATDPEAAIAWLRDRQETLDDLLCEVGAVVLRGFALPDTAAFSRAVEHYPEMAFGYAGGATPRSVIAGRAYEATRVPGHIRMQFHQEMAYLPHYPTKLAFFCAQPAEIGGETIIADVRRFDEGIPRALRDEVKRRGVRYSRNFRHPDWFAGEEFLDSSHLTWPENFGTGDKAEVEAICRAMGHEFRWEDNGSLSLIHTASGFVTHPRTGREIWFNHIQSQSPNPYHPQPTAIDRFHAFRHLYGPGRPPAYSTCYGDGTPIRSEDLKAAWELLLELEVAFPWQKSDLMLLDNFYVFHGRNTFTGNRNVQVALIG